MAETFNLIYESLYVAAVATAVTGGFYVVAKGVSEWIQEFREKRGLEK